MRKPIRWAAVLAAILLALYLASPWILAYFGQALVSDQTPQKADAILVLSGDAKGNRILKGASLMRDGYAPLVYVSGPAAAYGHSEDELAIRFVTEHGFPAAGFVGLPNKADSTLEEARLLLPVLRSRGVNKLLLVTSNYHSARAARAFRRTDPQMEIIIVAANDPVFPPDHWWGTRPGQKTFFFETTKTFADYVGL